MGTTLQNARIFIDSREQDALGGDAEACFDLGMAYSCGADMDLIEAHKWFNLSALAGYAPAQYWRAEVAEEMTAREIAQAQRQARAVLALQAARLAA